MDKHDRMEELLKEQRILGGGKRNKNYLLGLHDLVKENTQPHTEVVEIGSHRGVSTELFAIFCAKVYAVDTWGSDEDLERDTKRNTGVSAEEAFRERMESYTNVEMIKKYSSEASLDFRDQSLDMVYIDGDHSSKAVMEDLDIWIPKVKDGGVVSGHDGNNLAVRRALRRHSLVPDEIKHYSDSSWRFLK
jgi:predicted O-methyltransferase YrrM